MGTALSLSALSWLYDVCGAGSEELQVDLKGVLFSASVLPLAGTAMVVNITSTEAKVRATGDLGKGDDSRSCWKKQLGWPVLAQRG